MKVAYPQESSMRNSRKHAICLALGLTLSVCAGEVAAKQAPPKKIMPYLSDDTTFIIPRSDKSPTRIIAFKGSKKIGFLGYVSGTNGTRIVVSKLDGHRKETAWSEVNESVKKIDLTKTVFLNVAKNAEAKKAIYFSEQGKSFTGKIKDGPLVTIKIERLPQLRKILDGLRSNVCSNLPDIITITYDKQVTKFSIIGPGHTQACMDSAPIQGFSPEVRFGIGMAINDQQIVFNGWQAQTIISLPLSVNSAQIKGCHFLLDANDYESLAEPLYERVLQESSFFLREFEDALQGHLTRLSESRREKNGCVIKSIN